MLYGRERERAAVDALLDGARGGRSGVLLLRGEPGIGKTAVLEYAVAAAGDGFRVVRATGVEYEAELPFAGLSLLLASGLDRLDALPGPQRRSLEGAFGFGEAAGGTDRLLAGLATLGLLAELASEQPLLCVVDDVQWLDRSSLDALLIAARRLQAEGVALLLAARDTGAGADVGGVHVGGVDVGAGVEAGVGVDGPARPGTAAGPLAGLPELRLTGLAEPDAVRLLDDRTGAALTGPARRRLLAEAAGNPLALVELPSIEADLASGGLALTSRLRIAFHGQVTGLPPATQTLLLVAAAEENGELDVVLAAAAALGAGTDALEPAERAGLVTVGADRRFAFRHPLLRSAVLQRAPLQQRLAAHRALGETLEEGDRRTWHLALAATAPDAGLADALERTAARAEARGAHGGAAAAYERAAGLTPDRDGATRRLVLAAEAATEEGS